MKKEGKTRIASFIIKFALLSLSLAVIAVVAGEALITGAESALLASASSAEPVYRPVIIIDAGHGGMDGGAVSSSGLLEKDVNLGVARVLRSLFLLTDCEVVMTRDDDVMLCEPGSPHKKLDDLNNRLAFCDKYESCILVSIHQNTFPVQKYSGLQVYYSPNNEESPLLAERIQEVVASSLQPDNGRKVKKAGSSIYLLYNTRVPAVIVECGFLSNDAEAERLSSQEYREKIALCIFGAVMGYISDK